MKKFYILCALAICLYSFNSNAQTSEKEVTTNETKSIAPKFGVKLGYNIAKLRGSTPNFSPQAHNGFNVSAFYGASTSGLGYRTEIIFSRQGFSFDDNGKVQSVQQDYVFMPHLTTFTIAKRVQLQAGGQIGYLLNAKNEKSAPASEDEEIIQYMNRLDYGATLGFEIYPFKGFIIGGRYNISMGNPYKTNSMGSGGSMPIPFLPVNPADFKNKNAVLQFSVGYKF